MARKKRAAGEGTIAQRPDGMWVARLSLGFDTAGKRRRRSVYGLTQQAARAKLDRLRTEAGQGIIPVAGRTQTVGAYLQAWVEGTHKPRVRATTYRRTSSIVRVHLVPGLGRIRLTELTPQHVDRFLSEKLAEGQSPRSVHHLRAALRNALGQAVKWGLISRNAAALVAPPRVVQQEIKAVTPEHATAILEAVQGDRLAPLFTAALGTGLRQSELLGLRWGALDIENGVLDVRQTLHQVGSEYILEEPKTQRSRRTITLPQFVVATLRRQRTQQIEERLAAGERWQNADRDLVFTTATGAPLHGPHVTRHLQLLLARAAKRKVEEGRADEAAPRMTFHQLRHAAASLLLAQGIPITTISDVLGHSGIRVTADTYAHLAPQLRRDAARALDVAIGGGS